MCYRTSCESRRFFFAHTFGNTLQTNRQYNTLFILGRVQFKTKPSPAKKSLSLSQGDAMRCDAMRQDKYSQRVYYSILFLKTSTINAGQYSQRLNSKCYW